MARNVDLRSHCHAPNARGGLLRVGHRLARVAEKIVSAPAVAGTSLLSLPLAAIYRFCLFGLALVAIDRTGAAVGNRSRTSCFGQAERPVLF